MVGHSAESYSPNASQTLSGGHEVLVNDTFQTASNGGAMDGFGDLECAVR